AAAKMGVVAVAMGPLSAARQPPRLPLVLSAGPTAQPLGLPMGMPGIAPVLAGSRTDSLQEAKA
ncbi:hypothetical protein K4G89_23345, partial [Mycobacterium tuberculosis]|nr:hypothetical protein [Mycobacterium tuberculosis]